MDGANAAAPAADKTTTAIVGDNAPKAAVSEKGARPRLSHRKAKKRSPSTKGSAVKGSPSRQVANRATAESRERDKGKSEPSGNKPQDRSCGAKERIKGDTLGAGVPRFSTDTRKDSRGPRYSIALRPFQGSGKPGRLAGTRLPPPAEEPASGSSRNPSSSSTFPRTKESAHFPISVARIAGAALIALSTLLVSAIMASALTWLAPAHAHRALFLIGQLQSSCESDDCRTAVGFLQRSLDSRISACDDIYGFVCGGWGHTDETGTHLSYRERLYENYVRLAHNAMIAQRAEKAGARPKIRRLADIYGSCLSFFGNRTTSLRNLWEAAAVDPEEWLSVANFSGLFRLIVGCTIKNGLPSVLYITPATSTQVAFVRTGRSLGMGALVPDLVDQILSEASLALAMNLSKEGLSADVLELEDNIANITVAWRRHDAVSSFSVATLDDPYLGVAWSPILNDTGTLREIRCNNPSAVRSILTTLAAARRLKAAALYALLVPFSAFLGLEYCVAELRRDMDATIVRKMCLGNTELLFPRTFQRALSTYFEGNTPAANMTRMWTRIQEAGSQLLPLARGLKLDGHALKAVSISDLRATAPDGARSEPLGAPYGSDFVANLIVHAGATGRVVDVREMLVYELRRTRFVPTAYFSPDFYYAQATEPSVNYATMGSFVAKMLFNRSLPEHKLPGHTTCFIRYAKEQFGVAVPEQHEHVDRLLRTSWAMEVARAASRAENPVLDGNNSLAQLFYLRFAEPYCGETERSRIGALRYAAKTSTGFAEAFGCRQPEPVGC